MPQALPRPALWRGILTGLPFLLIVFPFAALFGALATGAGLSIAQTMGFSVLVIAGAAQFTALQLITEEAPTLVVLATALIVNLRMAMYSAALAPHLGGAPLATRALIGYLNVDQSYAASALEYERHPSMTLPEKLAFFLGIMIPVAPAWYAATLMGALLGPGLLPAQDTSIFLPLTFLAMVAPALKTWAHRAAAIAATLASLALAGLPYNLGLVPAAFLGMAIGAEIERRREGPIMTAYSSATIWLIIVVLGIGTFAIRFSFLGLLGNRTLPPKVLRYLRYTPVTVIPALMAPVLLWPPETGGTPEPARLIAAALTVAVGMASKSLLLALAAGAATFFALLYLM